MSGPGISPKEEKVEGDLKRNSRAGNVISVGMRTRCSPCLQSTAERMTLQQRQNLVTVAHRNGSSQATVEYSIRKAFVLLDGLCIALQKGLKKQFGGSFLSAHCIIAEHCREFNKGLLWKPRTQTQEAYNCVFLNDLHNLIFSSILSSSPACL